SDEHFRGSHSDYARYLAGMDASMRQKVALTAAHLLGEGRIADMGMGSGAGSAALAGLYPRLHVTGVDLSPTMVALARERFPEQANLEFVQGDIALPCFPAESLAGIFDSSVLHHVTSFGGYDRGAAARALTAQVPQLALGGSLIVRDFLDPGAGEVLLDLPNDDGDASDDPTSCSSAALFLRFAREFRCLLPEGERGFEAREVAADDLPQGWRRFRARLTCAVEFVLRKDYRADWEAEVKEEYTYLTQDAFEEVFARLGLRVLASTPLRNPWIVAHRFRGKFVLRDLEGRPLEDPATNYVIVGERVAPGAGVQLREAGPAPGPCRFLELEHHQKLPDGPVFDLARRPHLTVDLLPWFREGAELFVLARKSYPRPILTASSQAPALDGSRVGGGYVTEPLSVLQGDSPLGRTAEEALEARAGIGPQAIRGVRQGSTYYPSPGGVQEEVRSLLLETDPVFVNRQAPAVSGFSTSGQVRAIEARQALRAAQVGGLPNARLELNVYDLLLQLGEAPGPWIGAEVEVAEGPPAPATSVRELGRRPARRRFRRAPASASSGFLRVHRARFEELDAEGHALGEQTLEYVVPARLSTNTVAVALLRRVQGRVLLGLDDDDLPAVQAFLGNSQLCVAPAWRLPAEVTSLTPARAWLRARIAQEYGLRCGRIAELGGRYHPSPGVTPEVVYPFACEVEGELERRDRELAWVPLEEAVRERGLLPDGHLRVVSLRAAHATGSWPNPR
ncbi:MAG: methyltransferase domain-containing protein, partial [Planctomycetes bacterium]|nr:methyltransferase domain-containing protein [Planctomycetota bacterium]